MQVIAYKTLDLIDAIENRELVAEPIEGFVGCTIAKGSDMEGLPRAACFVQYLPLDEVYKVWWPDHRWAPEVQDYVDMIRDESGVADATGAAQGD